MQEKSLIHALTVAVRMRGFGFLLAALLSSLLPVGASAAPGDVSKFAINDDNPSASIPPLAERNADPLQFGYFLQDLFTKGELAFEKREWEKSAKYFEAIVKVVPDRARSFSRLCQCYQRVQKFELAAPDCGKAIALPGATLFDHKRFVETALELKTLTRADVANLDASIAHVRDHVGKLPDAEPLAESAPAPPVPAGASREEALAAIKDARIKREETKKRSAERAAFMLELESLACRLDLRLHDASRLTRCVQELKKQKANPRVLLTFEWARALIAKDRARSLALLEQARSLKIPEPTLQAMAREHEDAFSALALLKRYKFVAGAFVALVVIAGGLLAWTRRRQRPSVDRRSAASAREPAAS